MAPIKFSSGDVVVDRRADYARMLADSGDHTAAAELMEQALEICPSWTAGRVTLGEYYHKAGNDSEAIKAWREAERQDPEGIFGIALKLAAIGAAEAPQHPPGRYIEELFDDYADRFETSLVKKLGYDIPAKLVKMIPQPPGGKFTNAIDLGCGTGLMGEQLRPFCHRLEGFDISANMLARAREKKIYDHLGKADLSLGVEESGLFEGLPQTRADLVTSADVMIYLGALHGVFSLTARLCLPGAIFAFSVEQAQQDDSYVLLESLRFAHSANYVKAELGKSGFTVEEQAETTIRLDRGKPVPGLVFIARKTI